MLANSCTVTSDFVAIFALVVNRGDWLQWSEVSCRLRFGGAVVEIL